MKKTKKILILAGLWPVVKVIVAARKIKWAAKRIYIRVRHGYWIPKSRRRRIYSSLYERLLRTYNETYRELFPIHCPKCGIAMPHATWEEEVCYDCKVAADKARTEPTEREIYYYTNFPHTRAEADRLTDRD